MLAKFGKRNVNDIIQAVKIFNTEPLSIADVNALLQYLPSSNEITNIKKYITKQNNKMKTNENNEIKLGKAEQYFLELSKISEICSIEDRLTAMSIVLTISDIITKIQLDCDLIIKASQEIKGSERLKFIFKAIISLQNIINMKIYEKNGLIDEIEKNKTKGFKITSLSKLTHSKVNSGDTVQEVSDLYDI